MLFAARKNLLHFALTFALINTLVLYALNTRYFPAWPWPNQFVTQIFYISTYFGQIALLAFIMCFMLLLPIILIFPRRWLVFPCAVIFAGILVVFFVMDNNVYLGFGAHFTGQTLGLIMKWHHPLRVLDMSPTETLLFYSFIIGATAFEIIVVVLSIWLIRKPWLKLSYQAGIIIFMALCLLTSYSIRIWAAAVYNQPVIHLSIMLPYYWSPNANTLLEKIGVINTADLAKQPLQLPFNVSGKKLNYPLHPLQIVSSTKPYNIVLILIDTWRADMANKEVAPHIAEFAEQAQQFQAHFSGGDATQPGVFSLFYGLPGTYWNGMQDNHQDPLFLHTMQQEGYQFGIFASADIDSPPFDKTVFNHIPNLKLYSAGDEAWQRDETITNESIDFIKQHNKQPFFLFTFYDAVHAYSLPEHYHQPFTPFWDPINHAVLNNDFNPVDYFNRYKNAVYFDDNLTGKILAQLKQENLLQNTIVIITGDHGEEFNETKKNKWGHTSDFTRYQVQTPLIIYWPGKQPHIYKYQTTHYDVTPTLMHDALGVKNPVSDYSIGQSLFNSKPQRDFNIVLSYHYTGVVTANRITTFRPGAGYTVTDTMLNPISNDPYDWPTMLAANELLYKYYQ